MSVTLLKELSLQIQTAWAHMATLQRFHNLEKLDLVGGFTANADVWTLERQAGLDTWTWTGSAWSREAELIALLAALQGLKRLRLDVMTARL